MIRQSVVGDEERPEAPIDGFGLLAAGRGVTYAFGVKRSGGTDRYAGA